ncbi:hypothetical protein AKJ56_00595 [candidate division MSBL1 archaeon SCGC-AAA382N08]|uniref:Uncharacterized protein n=1 Tax=candidate division MSBL1 archaeon SCGC-AAA382N08 TaxID=1698285 RepID=A0A133VQG9_9EURY|nr:hypothetical protein AKJ56_00595 [candidate division MSBL1 archaeon SCGC-AAA382N08]
MSDVVFPEIGNHDGYVVELSLPPAFANDISDSLVRSSGEMDMKLGEKNAYVKLDEGRTFDILENLNLDPLKPELPALLLLDKKPEDIEKSDELVLVKLGALKKANDVPLILEELAQLVKNEEFMHNLSSNQKQKKLKETFKDISNVVVTLVSKPF